MNRNRLTQKRKPKNPGIHDRIYEVRGKLMLRKRDYEAYYTFSQNQIKENELKIKNLRAEIQEKRILQKQSMNADEYVIKDAFRHHKRSQLAMQRYTVAKAKNEKNEHVFDAVSYLNAAKHEKQKRFRKLKELQASLNNLISADEANKNDDSHQRVRVLMTSLDKMRLKFSSARFIQRTYKQILEHLEQNHLTIPSRLNMLEQNLETNKMELEGALVQCQIDAKLAYDQTKIEKEAMDSKILRQKRERDRKLAEVRKKFKQINQASQEKEYRPKKRNPQKAQYDTDAKAQISHDFWEEIRKFWGTKRSMDKLCEIVCVTQPESIAQAFQSQINRTKELNQTIEHLQKRRSVADENLSEYKKEYEINTRKYIRNKNKETEIEEKKNYNLDAVEFKRDKLKEEFGKSSSLLTIVIDSIKFLLETVSTCDWIKKQVVKLHGDKYPISAVMSSANGEIKINASNAVPMLTELGDKIYGMITFLSQAFEKNTDLVTEWKNDNSRELLVTVTSYAPQNTRVAIVDEEDVILAEDFFGDDYDVNDEYLSRENIKKIMRQYTESLTTKKRRKKSKKN